MLHIGTAGFSYTDWRGPVYPEGTKREEMLEHYARIFSMVELNFTYYRMPTESVTRGLDRRTPSDFRFSVKANKEMTHSKEVGDSELRTLCDSFLQGLDPLIRGGKLGSVLLQFPYSFKCNRENMERVVKLAHWMKHVSTVAEFRQVRWVEERPVEVLRENDIGFCCVDEPRLPRLMPPVVHGTSRVGYVRFHGRNKAKWWQHEQAWERYDYLYSEEELEEWTPRIRELASECEEVYTVFNNHYKGQAVQNALDLISLLDMEPS